MEKSIVCRQKMDNKKQRQGFSMSLLPLFPVKPFSAIPRPDHVHIVIAVLSHTVLFFFDPASVVIRHLSFILCFPDNDTDISFCHGVLFHAVSPLPFRFALRSPSR